MLHFVDTHAHLYLKQFALDRSAMISRAIENGVDKLFLPNIDVNSIRDLYALVDLYPKHCFPMMGLHPCSVKADHEAVLNTIEEHLRAGNPQAGGGRFVAVGEIGLDYHWDLTFKAEQQAGLRRQISWAKELQLPIVLHTRKAFDDTYSIVKEMHDDQLCGVFHCFSGSVEEAQKVMDLGFYIGIGGVLTYKKSGLDNLLTAIDLSKVVLETDAPYLAPTPFRGKRNESAYIKNIAEKLAEVKGISLSEVATITTENALNLYKMKVSV